MFFLSSSRRHTRWPRDWSSDVCSFRSPVLPSSTVVTPAFLNTALGLGHPALTEDIKLAYKAPYSNSTHRGGIGGFVADIPVSERSEERRVGKECRYRETADILSNQMGV